MCNESLYNEFRLNKDVLDFPPIIYQDTEVVKMIILLFYVCYCNYGVSIIISKPECQQLDFFFDQ